jgi:hypothetical protein
MYRVSKCLDAFYLQSLDVWHQIVNDVLVILEPQLIRDPVGKIGVVEA